MGKINKLSKQTAELIAAGEVVERPASVVKELVENSIDAGATRILVEIINGGISLIRVNDNGEGVDKDDAKLAFMRYATSKIAGAEDLSAISTMGFRGEALAAISAVSRVVLLTRRPQDIEGVHLSLEAGELTDEAPAGCPQGTTIVIKDLFFNTPARMKFLGRNTAEAAACEAVMEKTALSRPDIAFRMIKDGQEVLRTEGNGSLSDTIYSLLKADFHKGLIKVEGSSDGVEVSGFVSSPQAARGNRRMQYLFVNSRPVRSVIVSSACEEAFRGLMTSGRFPAFVLNVTLAPSQVDVNVHPAKTEVKFANPRRVGEAVYIAVRSALEALSAKFEQPGAKAQPEEKPALSAQTMHFGPVERSMSPSQAGRLFESASENNPFAHLPSEFAGALSLASERPVLFTQFAEKEIPPEAQQAFASGGGIFQTKPEIKLVGEFFGVYILAEYDKKLVVVDKHAAHEKRIYNLLCQNPENLASQFLLTPSIVRLTREQTRVVLENADIFSSLGFEIEDFGEGSLIIRSIPSISGQEDIAAILEEAADIFSAGKKGGFGLLDRLMFSIACKAAVRAGDKNSPAELMAVLEAVLSSDELRNCPHGRPVLAVFSRAEVEKWFMR